MILKRRRHNENRKTWYNCEACRTFKNFGDNLLLNLCKVILLSSPNLCKLWRTCCGFNSADIWSVGCTVIEMATGKPPWSQQYQEVPALFHIGTTKSHPPIPDHLSAEAQDFLLKCLHKEPDLRPTASDLLQHPFVTGEYRESHPVNRTSVIDHSGKHMEISRANHRNSVNPEKRPFGIGSDEVHDMCNVRCSTIYPENLSGDAPNWGSSNYDDDMCQIDDEEDFFSGVSIKRSSTSLSADVNKVECFRMKMTPMVQHIYNEVSSWVPFNVSVL